VMYNHLKQLLCFFAILAALQFFCGAADVMASEGAGWRHTYDRVLLVFNFALLAFLILKFLRKPLVNFLQAEKKSVEVQIRQVEKEMELAQKKLQENNKIADESDAALEKLKQRILDQGKRRKEEIIQDARHESRLILEEAKTRIEGRIFDAKNMIKAELVDTVVELALKKLPKEITAEDDQKIIEDYLTHISAKS